MTFDIGELRRRFPAADLISMADVVHQRFGALAGNSRPMSDSETPRLRHLADHLNGQTGRRDPR
jgi:hypothetical protein